MSVQPITAHDSSEATRASVFEASSGSRVSVLAPGTRIGNYLIERFLGEGGMGTVYLARQQGLDRQVVVKFLKQDSQLARFQREAKAVARIDHPQVVKIIELGDAGGQAYMVLEYLAKGDLADHVRGAPVTLDQLLGWLDDCLLGLEALHQAGMIHRDIKPANIFLDANGRAKLGDLGLARSVTGEDQVTMQQDTTGTPAYLSPEQARSGTVLDIRTDIYSLGATFYSLISGQKPFSGSLAEIFHQVLTADPPRLRSLKPDLSASLAAVIETAMHKDREKRYATPAQMRAALAVARGRAVSTGNRNSLPVIIVVLLLAAGAGGWWWSTQRQMPSSDTPARAVGPVPTPRPVTPTEERIVAPTIPAAPIPSTWYQKTGTDAHGTWAEMSVGTATFRFRQIPAGTARLGSPANEERRASDEIPHEVAIAAFWVGATEVTQAQWLAVMGQNPSRFTTDPRQPVERVSWDEVQAFLTTLNQKARLTARLPSADEWEYACRAGSQTPFTAGAMLEPEAAVFDGNFTYGGSARGRRRSVTEPVGSCAANRWGLFDVHGNVAEWCSDELPEGQRLIRGGSWSDPPWNCRSAARFTRPHDHRHPEIGFRLVIPIQP